MPNEKITLLDQSLRGERVPLEAIPVIDFSRFLAGDPEARRRIAREIGAACRNIGFFYLTGHGVPDDLIARTFAEAKRFFDLPAEAALRNDLIGVSGALLSKPFRRPQLAQAVRKTLDGET